MPTSEEIRRAVNKALEKAAADGLITIGEDGQVCLNTTLIEELSTQPIDERFVLKA